MAIPLRVLQKFFVGADGKKVYAEWEFQVKGAEGWKKVPVVEEEVPAPKRAVQLELPFEGTQL
jgi:hypothetical protein